MKASCIAAGSMCSGRLARGGWCRRDQIRRVRALQVQQPPCKRLVGSSNLPIGSGQSPSPKAEANMDTDLVNQVIDTAQRVVASGAVSAKGHGNVSLRVTGADEMYFTAGPSLRNHAASAVVRVGLDGTLREGGLPPIQGAVVAMHTAMYIDNPDVGCVLHTHSP